MAATSQPRYALAWFLLRSCWLGGGQPVHGLRLPDRRYKNITLAPCIATCTSIHIITTAHSNATTTSSAIATSHASATAFASAAASTSGPPAFAASTTASYKPPAFTARREVVAVTEELS